jgi:hypothetical protein
MLISGAFRPLKREIDYALKFPLNAKRKLWVTEEFVAILKGEKKISFQDFVPQWKIDKFEPPVYNEEARQYFTEKCIQFGLDPVKFNIPPVCGTNVAPVVARKAPPYLVKTLERRGFVEERMKLMPQLLKEYKEVCILFTLICSVALKRLH